MNIFNIGKANARITELESELAAHKENQTAIEKQAETFQANLKTAQDAVAAKDSEISAIKNRAEKAESDLAAANAKQADFDAKVATAASKKAREITAAVGVPPVTTPKPEAAKETAELKGRERFTASIKIHN